MTIRVLKKQGKTIKAIVRETGVSRNTVRKYLDNQEMPRYRKRSGRVSKLDPYKAYIGQRIKAAHPDWIPAAVIYQEILAQGYPGKIRILSNYLARLKPRTKPDPVVRFETAPGQQMQVDFTTIYRGRETLKAFVATLGNSRASYVHFYDNERTETWIEGLVRSFEFFGGVAHEVLFDNAKTIMIERDAYAPGQHRWNAALLSIANDYGFIPKVCRPYRAKTKGKVERFNGYLKSSFVVPLKATLRSAGLKLDVAAANAHIGIWLTQVANERVHGTTGSIPNHLLQLEQNALLPLPVKYGNAVAHPALSNHCPPPVESLQHPLCIYDQFLEGAHEFAI